MNVLITGGAGYIGSELVGYLIDNHNVTVLDSLMYDYTSLLRYTQNDRFNFVKGDVRNTKLLYQLMKKNDIILPLAALVGFPLCDDHPGDAKEVNYGINRYIAEHKSADQMVIYPCTNSGYGVSKDGSVCTELSPLNPVSLYGKTKVMAERAYQETENCVLYECEFMRNYVHVADVCRAFKFTLENWESCKNETYNVGNDALNMNKLQLAQKIQKHLPLEIIKAEFTTDPDVRDYIVSSEKFYSKDFKCEYDLDEGIEQLVKAYAIIDSPWFANY